MRYFWEIHKNGATDTLRFKSSLRFINVCPAQVKFSKTARRKQFALGLQLVTIFTGSLVSVTHEYRYPGL